MTKHAPRYSISQQRGAALIVSLVMMVVLTLIGVVAMNSSNIELIMAGNTQLQTRALANAERTLTSAESVADSLSIQGSYSEAGYYNVSGGSAKNPQDMYWDGTDSAQDTDENNRFMIEYTGNFDIPGNSIVLGNNNTPLQSVDIFRVTARSEDVKGAVRMVQSIFVQPI